MSAGRLALLASTSVVLSCASVGQAQITIAPRPLSPTQAQVRATRGADKWIREQDLPASHPVAPKCLQLSAASWKCMATVYCNSAGTIPYAELTIHVWNTSVAPNGSYWSHEHLVASYKVLC